MTERPPDLADAALLELVQRQTFRYFWDFAHPVSGLARERSTAAFGYGAEVVTSGGTGFGVMAIVVAAERRWITRAAAVARLLQILRFLAAADRHHGVFPHFLHGETGRTIPFSPQDDGGDLVETAFLVAGLLCARQYFGGAAAAERELRERIDRIWHAVEWDWHTRGGRAGPLLALEPEPRLGHGPRDPRLGRGADRLRARGVLAPPRDRRPGLPPRAGRRAGRSGTAGRTTASPCRSAATAAARCSSRTIPSWPSTRAA